MRVRTIAPAKINWTLEVLGRRPDGYHEIRSVMQTIDLQDTVEMSPAPDLREVPQRRGNFEVRVIPHKLYWAGGEDLWVEEGPVPGTDLINRATQLLDPRGERDVRLSFTKRIPVAAGLGGGSSDAGATLRGLDRLWELGLQPGELAPVAAEIGADVTFFLYGGTALAEGRGERVTPLPDATSAWLVVVAPPIWIQEKTKRMYEVLKAEDFSDGQRTEALAERLKQGDPVRSEDLYNAFERAAYESFAGLAAHRDRLLGAGAKRVQVAGAGPAVFAVFDSREEADRVAAALEGSEARVFVARTLTAAEATRVDVE